MAGLGTLAGGFVRGYQSTEATKNEKERLEEIKAAGKQMREMRQMQMDEQKRQQDIRDIIDRTQGGGLEDVTVNGTTYKDMPAGTAAQYQAAADENAPDSGFKAEAGNARQVSREDAVTNALRSKGYGAAADDYSVSQKKRGLEMGLLEHQIRTQPDRLKQDYLNGQLNGQQLQGRFLDSFSSALGYNPDLALELANTPEAQGAFGVKQPKKFVSIRQDPKNPGAGVLVAEDGSTVPFDKASLEGYADKLLGRTGSSIHNIPDGGLAVVTDKRGRVTGRIENPKEPNPAKGENQRLLVNDATNQIALAFGAKMDPITKMIDTSSINDPEGYSSAIAEAERRVRGGETPMGVASEIATRFRRKAEGRRVVTGQGGSGAGQAPGRVDGKTMGLW